MSGFQIYDVVVLLADVPKEGLRKGQVGTVLLRFDQPQTAYEVEFADAQGRTTAQLALLPDQLGQWRDERSADPVTAASLQD